MAVQVPKALFRCPLRAGCFVLCGTFYIFPSTNTFDGVLGEHRQGAYAGAGRAPRKATRGVEWGAALI